MRVAKGMAVDCLPDLRGKLREARGKLACRDHAMEQRLDEREVHAKVDPKLPGARDGLATRQDLGPVMQDARDAREVGIDAVGARKAL